MAYTFRNLLSESLVLCGQQAIAVSGDPDETNYALSRLNSTLDMWRADDNMSFGLQEITGNTVVNQEDYLIGPSATGSGSVVTPKPMDIKALSVRYASSVINVEQIFDPADWQRIDRLTSLRMPWPSMFRFVSGFPNGTLSLYPVPSAAIPFVAAVAETIPQNVTMNDVVQLPPGYREALIYAVAEQMCIVNGQPERLQLIQPIARDLVEKIRKANSTVPILKIRTAWSGTTNQATGKALITGAW